MLRGESIFNIYNNTRGVPGIQILHKWVLDFCKVYHLNLFYPMDLSIPMIWTCPFLVLGGSGGFFFTFNLFCI